MSRSSKAQFPACTFPKTNIQHGLRCAENTSLLSCFWEDGCNSFSLKTQSSSVKCVSNLPKDRKAAERQQKETGRYS